MMLSGLILTMFLPYIDYLYMRTVQMQAEGKFKMTKKQKRKDKTPGTIFDWLEERDDAKEKVW